MENQQKPPLVSFVVPVYNIEKYVEQCIISLMNQTESNIEILLVDDGSSDGSGEICDRYAKKDNRIRVIHQQNQGVSVARNQGMEQALGEWICLIDGDDWVEECLCAKMRDHLKDNLDILFFGYSFDYESGNKKVISEKTDRIDLKKSDFRNMQTGIFNAALPENQRYKAIPYFTPWGKFFNRKFVEKYRLRYTEGVKKGQDGLFNIRAYQYAKKGAYINQTLYHYRVNNDSVCHRYNKKIVPILDHLLRQYKDFMREFPSEKLEDNFYCMIARQLMYCIILDFCHKDNPKSYRERKADFSRVCKKEIYRDAVKRVKIRNLKKQEGVLLVLIRMKAFGVICILNRLREKM